MNDEAQQLVKRGRGRPRGSKNRPKPEGWNSKRIPAAQHDPRSHAIKPRHALFVQHYLRHLDGPRACREAGYTGKNLSHTAHRLLHEVPAVIEAVAVARKEIALRTEYDGVAAMGEAYDAMEFSKQTGNASAYVKAVELRAKLQGLLVERVDQRQVGGFQIRILGIDDNPPAAPTPTFAEVFDV